MNSVYREKDIERNAKRAGFNPMDIVVVGGTGTGKSTTMNTLFEREIAKVGYGCDPETSKRDPKCLNRYLRFWDTPGFGDSIEKDNKYAKKLIKLLNGSWSDNGANIYGVIDMVLVILDGSGRDMGTTYKILNDVVLPNFPSDRILVAINQADAAKSPKHWNNQKNEPDEVLKSFLEEKAVSVMRRIEEATGTRVCKPVYYSAEKEYNVEKLLDMIIDNMPTSRRKMQ